MCQAAGRHMVRAGRGRIVNLSSQAGSVGILRHAAYCASKGGVEQLTRVLALEWAPHGVTVNTVAPTFIRTPRTAERLDDPAFAAGVLGRIPLGRVGDPMDVAGAVIYLASDAARLDTGSVLMVDGGWTAGADTRAHSLEHGHDLTAPDLPDDDPIEVGSCRGGLPPATTPREGCLTSGDAFQHLLASDSVGGRHVPRMCPAAASVDEELIEFLIRCSGGSPSVLDVARELPGAYVYLARFHRSSLDACGHIG
jgi:hypothetical protein